MTKEQRIEAILKRIKEVMMATERLQEFTITITGNVYEVTGIEYDMKEVVNDWEVED